MMEIISFIILHYIAIEETIACVDSIKKMKMQDNIKILIVDNASPNQSGKVLHDIYEKDAQVNVILNKENEGFSRGNNKGCLYAKMIWNPFFYVVTNNDVIFVQKDFVERLFEEYKKKKFDILGMDIYCPVKGIHQSPLAKCIPGMRDVNKTIIINKLMLRCFTLLFPVIRLYYKRIDLNGHDAINYDEYQENICVMGACIVLAKEYMERRERPFWPETRFYYEEFLLSLWCKNNDARIVYQPKIKVVHNEGISTKQISSCYMDKVKFRIENVVDSAEIFKAELERLIQKKSLSGRD